MSSSPEGSPKHGMMCYCVRAHTQTRLACVALQWHCCDTSAAANIRACRLAAAAGLRALAATPIKHATNTQVKACAQVWAGGSYMCMCIQHCCLQTCACVLAGQPGVHVYIHAGCCPLGWPEMGLCNSLAHSTALCQSQGKAVDVHALCVGVQVTCSKVVVKEMHRQVHKHTSGKTDRFTRQNTVLFLQVGGKGQPAA
jgi:hypothetical protein